MDAERRDGRGGRAAGRERGFALVWSLLAVVGLTLLGVAGHLITQGDTLLSDNFETEGRGLYSADAALSEYFGIYAPLGVPNGEFTCDKGNSGSGNNSGSCNGGNGGGNKDDEEGVDSVLTEFHGSDLDTRSFDYLDAKVTITPKKLSASINGDIWLLSAAAEVDDPRTQFPRADRTLSTHARLVPPFQMSATVMAPNGFVGGEEGDDIKIEGKSKGKCGEGNIPALSTPENTTTWDNHKTELKSEDPYKNEPHDESAADHEELVERLGADWDILGDPSVYEGKDNFYEIPGDYSSLDQVDFGDFDKKKEKWPIFYHHGTADLASQEKVKGHGFLVVEDSLIVGKEKLDWKGMIVVGKVIHLTQDDGHMHLKGGMITGLACTDSELTNGECENLFEGKHLDVKFHSCEVDAAWSQLMSLAPLGRTRYTELD